MYGEAYFKNIISSVYNCMLFSAQSTLFLIWRKARIRTYWTSALHSTWSRGGSRITQVLSNHILNFRFPLTLKARWLKYHTGYISIHIQKISLPCNIKVRWLKVYAGTHLITWETSALQPTWRWGVSRIIQVNIYSHSKHQLSTQHEGEVFQGSCRGGVQE